MKLNAWAVYNWENGTEMSQKLFQLEVARGLLKEAVPGHSLCTPRRESDDDDQDIEDLLSPSTKSVTPAERFVCRKPEEGSIGRSKKYK